MIIILGSIPSHEMILELEKQLTCARIAKWLGHDLFALQWWLLVAVFIIPWFIWWRYVDKKSLMEIVVCGAIVLIISSFLDSVLSELGVWSYDYEIIPVWPRLISADFTLLPITYMFAYQYFKEWQTFVPAIVIVSAFLAFVGEPFLTWLNIYQLSEWKHVYSFPIYITLGVFVKWLVQTILAHIE